MRIAIVGGGPAGLYFAILAKRLDAAHEVRVYERNAADDTFGFGVVFSDETLESVAAAEPATFAELAPQFARWAEIDIHYRGERGDLGRPRLLGAEPPRPARRPPAARRRARGGAALQHRGRSTRARAGRPDRRRRRRQQHGPRPARGRLRAIARPAPVEVHVARHRPRLRRLQVLHRRDRARRLPGPRLSLRGHDEHVHRGDLRGDLAARGARPHGRAGAGGERRRRASRSARSCSPARSTATA